MATSLPRRLRISASGSVTRSCGARSGDIRSRPRKYAWPETLALGSRMSCMSDIIETLLPEPDSPTMPSTSPWSTVKDRPSTAVTVPRRVRKRTVRSRTSRNGSGTAHPGVDGGVDDVDHRVGEHDEERRVQHAGDDHREVEVLQGVVGEQAEAGQAEHHLVEQRGAADERAEVKPEQRHDGDEGAAQRVDDEDAPLRQALGP